MLRLLIPLVDNGGAPLAARHAAFLFSEHCVADVELLEVLAPIEYGRAAAFRSRRVLWRREKRATLSALAQTRAILDDAGVPYTSHTVIGDAAHTIAARAAEKQSDMVLIDASRFHFLRRMWTLSKLWRLPLTPVTLLH
jgi:nucleotide-binding universal stress UspA family protein